MISKRNRQILSFFYKDKNKKNWMQIMREFSALYVSDKELPINYISHLLYRKDTTDYRDYLRLKENRKLLQWSHSRAEGEIVLVENKLKFERFLNQRNIRTPQIYFHNTKNKFIYKGDFFEIKNKNDFTSFLANVFEAEKIDQLFCKPVDGIRGEHIFILKKRTTETIADEVMDLILSKAFIFQELISQHAALKNINPSSINTLRIITYKNEDNEVEILSGFIRFGRKGAIIDNAHIGGIVVAFDKDTGELRDKGIQLIDNGGGIFFEHPDSGIVFENQQIPLYSQVKNVARDAASAFQFPLLGWDIALTPDGPIIIEANHDFHLLLSDLMEKGFRKNPTVRKLIERIT